MHCPQSLTDSHITFQGSAEDLKICTHIGLGDKCNSKYRKNILKKLGQFL